MTIATTRRDILCFGTYHGEPCRQLVAYIWPDGQLIPVARTVMRDKRDGRLRLRCEKCGKWIKPKV